MGTTSVHTKNVITESNSDHSHTQEVCTRVLYNSNYLRNKGCHLVTKSKLDCTLCKCAQNARKNSGENRNTKPPLKKQYTDMACTDKMRDTDSNANNSADRWVEVSTVSHQQTMMKATENTAGSVTQGHKTVVAPVIADNTCKTKVSKSLCHSGNQTPMSVNKLVINPHSHTNDVSNAFGVSPENTSTEENSILLFYINNMCDTDKFLNNVSPKRVRALMEGNKASDCSAFIHWRDQTQSDFGFIPLSNFELSY